MNSGTPEWFREIISFFFVWHRFHLMTNLIEQINVLYDVCSVFTRVPSASFARYSFSWKIHKITKHNTFIIFANFLLFLSIALQFLQFPLYPHISTVRRVLRQCMYFILFSSRYNIIIYFSSYDSLTAFLFHSVYLALSLSALFFFIVNHMVFYAYKYNEMFCLEMTEWASKRLKRDTITKYESHSVRSALIYTMPHSKIKSSKTAHDTMVGLGKMWVVSSHFCFILLCVYLSDGPPFLSLPRSSCPCW